MKIIYPSGSLSNYVDRNPDLRRLSSVSINQAPHALAIRSLDVITTGKKAIVHYVSASVFRNVVPTASGLVMVQFDLTDSVGDKILWQFRREYAAAGDNDHQNLQLNLIVSAGDFIRIRTEDLSTGGQMGWSAFIAYTEFDG